MGEVVCVGMENGKDLDVEKVFFNVGALFHEILRDSKVFQNQPKTSRPFTQPSHFMPLLS